MSQSPDQWPSFVVTHPTTDKKYLVELRGGYIIIHREGEALPVVFENDIVQVAIGALQQFQSPQKIEAPELILPPGT